MKADQIRAQQPVEQVALPWADAERFRVGPRDVPEDGHARVGPLVLDQAAGSSAK